ncbi:4-hydroxy-tetrahydrodipicolinate synthase [Brevibacterium litoralis]|uniref:4-hydroxy-tetrahydrodipicolinate synthase n=1 Tax=Brevibacterium litoralis TaxID=3138935 RepID=UPI0032EFE332
MATTNTDPAAVSLPTGRTPGAGSDTRKAAVEAFGTVGTAMITPFTTDGRVDLDTAASLADHLVSQGHDMLVVSGTTGESPTTNDVEKQDLLTAVLGAVGDRARVIAGIGTNDTAHTEHLAQDAASAGAHGLLLVTPYYSKPPQAAIRAHMEQAASATDLPVMLYDIPGRSGVPIEPETLLALGAHPNILAVKDAKGDLASSMSVMAHDTLAYYSGEDALNLPLLAAGAVGVVSVAGHVLGAEWARMVTAVAAGDLACARSIAYDASDVVDAVMNHMPGAISAKAALELQGVVPNRVTRMPLLPATEDQVAFLRERLTRSGYLK